MTSFRDFVLAHKDEAAIDIARKALAEIPEQVLPYIAHEVETILRNEASAMERRVLTPFLKRAAAAPLPVGPPTAELMAALRIRVNIAGKDIPFGELTVADHKERIRALEAQREGLGDTIKRHQMAIEVIEREHTNTLDEAVAKMADKAA
jgi:uncharacterized protein (DUF305 family)